jgi:hypothetical protein
MRRILSLWALFNLNRRWPVLCGTFGNHQGKSASLDEPARSSLMWIPEGTQLHKLTLAAYMKQMYCAQTVVKP